jgi:group I intron endonuclease
MNGFIYKITNNINNKVYIGKTLLSVEERFKEHCNDSQKTTINKRPLYNAMKKYGTEHFSIEVVEEVPIENLSEKEKYWIQFYDSYGKNGYNATLGGDGKQLYDYEAIVKGYKEGKLQKELAEEFECSIDTISKALFLSNLDPFENAKIKNSKPIMRLDKKTNEVLQTFSSRKEAAQWIIDNKLSKTADIDNIIGCIGRAANNIVKSSYGYKWKNL